MPPNSGSWQLSGKIAGTGLVGWRQSPMERGTWAVYCRMMLGGPEEDLSSLMPLYLGVGTEIT